MLEDAVIRELWKVKDRHAAKYGYNIRKMARSLRREQARSGHKVVTHTRRSQSQTL